MARQTIELVTCDVCGQEKEGVRAFIIKGDDLDEREEIQVDLCPEHAKPIHEIMKYGRPYVKTRSGRKQAHSLTPYKPKGAQA